MRVHFVSKLEAADVERLSMSMCAFSDAHTAAVTRLLQEMQCQ